MGVYTIEVNDTAVMAFFHHGPLLEAAMEFENPESRWSLMLSEHVGQDGRPLYDDGDNLNLRSASPDEYRGWHDTLHQAVFESQGKGLNHLDHADVMTFLVPATMIVDELDEEEAAQ